MNSLRKRSDYLPSLIESRVRKVIAGQDFECQQHSIWDQLAWRLIERLRFKHLVRPITGKEVLSSMQQLETQYRHLLRIS